MVDKSVEHIIVVYMINRSQNWPDMIRLNENPLPTRELCRKKKFEITKFLAL